MQAVGPMAGQEFHAQILDPLLQLAGTKNPNVSAFDFVIRIAELPADPFWEIARHTDGEQSAGFQY